MDNALILVKAFENFIIPIVNAHAPDLNNKTLDDVKSSPNELEPKAWELIAALQHFVTDLMRPKSDQDYVTKDATDELALGRLNEKMEIIKDPEDYFMAKSLNEHAVPTALTPAKSPLLKLALNRAHQCVYNEIPIRLLTFKPDGTGIRLVERNEMWRSISTAIESEFNEDAVKSDIQQRQVQDSKAEKTVIATLVSKYTRFAILSHAWLQGLHGGGGEVTYADWNAQKFDTRSAGYRKLSNFCRVAATDYKLTLGWMDTICINKESSSELDESIRSMFNWYWYSTVCVTYLAGTTELQNMHDDPWFTRGWTLQELIAPRFIKFYSANWDQLASGPGDDKKNHYILQEIHTATTITKDELSQLLWKIPVSRRMQWAAKRHVTREEDTAYSLMGIFDVSMHTAYGEGAERAFVRLVKEILNDGTSTVLDLVNYGYGPEYPVSRTLTVRTSSLIPPSPKRYLWRADRNIQWYRPMTPVILTQLGLYVSVLLLPGLTVDPSSWTTVTPKGNYYGAAEDIDLLSLNNQISRRSFNLLDYSLYDGWNPLNRGPRQDVVVFGVLNIAETATTITLPPQGVCYAVQLAITPPPVAGIFAEDFTTTRWVTVNAIVFDLKQHHTNSYVIPKSELRRHGMTLRTMYL